MSIGKFSFMTLILTDKFILLVLLASSKLTKEVTFSEEATLINKHDHNTKPYYYNTSCFFDLGKNVTGHCHCPNPNKALKNFVCECVFNSNISDNISLSEKITKIAIDKRENYICSCIKKINRTYSEDCTCISNPGYMREMHIINNISCIHLNRKDIIKLGALIPFSLGDSTLSSYSSGWYYASAMFLALEDVNNDKYLLPNHTLALVWEDTECDWRKAISMQLKMLEEEHVDAFIGGGCRGCLTNARIAGAQDLPMISHMCLAQELSDKNKYPTFARTEPIGRQLTLALRELLQNFKWKKFGLLVEQSPTYLTVHNEVKTRFKYQILIEKEISGPAHYFHAQHFKEVKNDMEIIKRQARIVVLLMSIRVLKESLIAAAELDMIGGEYVFLAFEINLADGLNRQKFPFKWTTADFGYENENVEEHKKFPTFIERSQKLCRAWEVTLLLMPKSSSNKKNEANADVNFNQRVKLGMKAIFNKTVHESYIKGTNYSSMNWAPPKYAQNLYDAVMFLAIAINDTISKDQNYSSGVEILKNMENKSFSSIHGYEIVYDENKEVQYPFRLYRFGKKRGSYDCLCLLEMYLKDNKCENPWPQMEEIADLDFVEINKTNGNRIETIREFRYTAIPNAPMYWPGETPLDQVKDIPVCGFDGNCLEEGSTKEFTTLVTAIPITLVVVVLIILLIVVKCRQYQVGRVVRSQQLERNSDDLTSSSFQSSQVCLVTTGDGSHNS